MWCTAYLDSIIIIWVNSCVTISFGYIADINTVLNIDVYFSAFSSHWQPIQYWFTLVYLDTLRNGTGPWKWPNYWISFKQICSKNVADKRLPGILVYLCICGFISNDLVEWVTVIKHSILRFPWDRSIIRWR